MPDRLGSLATLGQTWLNREAISILRRGLPSTMPNRQSAEQHPRCVKTKEPRVIRSCLNETSTGLPTCGYRLDHVGDAIRVSNDGLRVLAAQCDAAAEALSSSAAPAVPGPPCQATAVATTCGYTHLESAAAVLARRVATTGAKLRAAGTIYVDGDEASADQI
jgi:hypothetical protein